MPPETEGEGPRILIVDDQRSNLKLLEQTLRRAGYSAVMCTTEPQEVASLQAEHHYDLILLDLQMPGMNGFEVMEKLRETRAANPVAILVISAEPRDKAAALQAGADSFLGKPFRIPDVVERVQAMLKP